MLSEKYLDENIRGLSEFEVRLIYARSATVIFKPRNLTFNTLAGHYSERLNIINKRFKELID
jgi:hypothetical protein